MSSRRSRGVMVVVWSWLVIERTFVDVAKWLLVIF